MVNSIDELRDEVLEKELNTRMAFGRHKGFTVGEVLDQNPSYLVWAYENVESFTLSSPVLTEAYKRKNARGTKRYPYHDNYDEELEMALQGYDWKDYLD